MQGGRSDLGQGGLDRSVGAAGGGEVAKELLETAILNPTTEVVTLLAGRVGAPHCGVLLLAVETPAVSIIKNFTTKSNKLLEHGAPPPLLDDGVGEEAFDSLLILPLLVQT